MAVPRGGAILLLLAAMACASAALQRHHGIEYFGAAFSFGTMAHAKVMASMTLFAEQVMPKFREVHYTSIGTKHAAATRVPRAATLSVPNPCVVIVTGADHVVPRSSERRTCIAPAPFARNPTTTVVPLAAIDGSPYLP